jgi:hypothetical protein
LRWIARYGETPAAMVAPQVQGKGDRLGLHPWCPRKIREPNSYTTSRRDDSGSCRGQARGPPIRFRDTRRKYIKITGRVQSPQAAGNCDHTMIHFSYARHLYPRCRVLLIRPDGLRGPTGLGQQLQSRMSGLSPIPVVLGPSPERQSLATERTRFAGEVAREVARSAGGVDRLNALG